MLTCFTCSNENVSDFHGLNNLILFHPDAEEIHHVGKVVLVCQPGHHPDIEVRSGEVAGVDELDHLLDALLVSILDVDFFGSPLQHVGLHGRLEDRRARTEEILVNVEDLHLLLLPARNLHVSGILVIHDLQVLSEEMLGTLERVGEESRSEQSEFDLQSVLSSSIWQLHRNVGVVKLEISPTPRISEVEGLAGFPQSELHLACGSISWEALD